MTVLPVTIEDGKLDTPSSPNTVAGKPVLVSKIVTVTPSMSAPLVESNTRPNGSTSAEVVITRLSKSV
jgi:hypothetical protein